MPSVEKISIALSRELATTVKEAVASGKYASASEVVREALRDWQTRQDLRHAELQRLRRAWVEGIASGEAEALDMDALKQAGPSASRFQLTPGWLNAVPHPSLFRRPRRSHRYLVQRRPRQSAGRRLI